MTQPTSAPSYRALLSVPTLGRMILGMQVARIAQSMVSVVIVLFTLTRYGSPELAGLVVAVGTLPGILVSPIAGALLDRHGRIRLVMLDYLVAAASLVLIGALALANLLPAAILVAIAGISSLTLALSQTGLRSLFPILVPEYLWERANAVDSNGYVVAQILGPPAAAGLFAVAGGPLTMFVIAAAFCVAAVAIIGVADPVTDTASTGSLMLDAWQGLVYTWHNRTLRGLGFALSTINLAGGMITIVIPLLILTRLGLGEAAIGIPFALSGVAGMASAFYFGRVDSRGREWLMLVLPMVGMIGGLALLLPVGGATASGGSSIDPALGFGLVAASMLVTGFLNGPLDIALFTVRQRRTDPAVLGRAFAVSMAFNFLGYPIGAAIAGALADRSLVGAILFGVVACAAAAVFAAVLIPRTDDSVQRLETPAGG
ncbi:MAG: MFS transporter [Chloroflexota bacterium]|nr:MFS transporter [Chloroflexota bacterium]